MASQTLYEILGVLEEASPDEIKAAYRRKMQYLHPDRGGSEEAATQVNAAYDVLSDAGQRAEYDRSRQGGVAHCPLCDDLVQSEGELVKHLVRHRAEVEAAQAVVAQEDARRAQKSSQPAGSTGGDQGTDGRRPSTVVSGSRRSEPRRSLSTSSASG
jgi:curved DNA-binding protein CbpA